MKSKVMDWCDHNFLLGLIYYVCFAEEDKICHVIILIHFMIGAIRWSALIINYESE